MKDKRKKEGFTRLPNWFFGAGYFRELCEAPNELKIYLELLYRYNRDKGGAWPGPRAIGKETGVRWKSAQHKAKKGLIAKGLIRPKNERGAHGMILYDIAQTQEQVEVWKKKAQFQGSHKVNSKGSQGSHKKNSEQSQGSFKVELQGSFHSDTNQIKEPSKPPSSEALTKTERKEGGGLLTPHSPLTSTEDASSELIEGAHACTSASEPDWTALIEGAWEKWIERKWVEKEHRLTLDRQIAKYSASRVAQAMLKIDGKDNPNGYIVHLIATLNP